MTPVQLGRKAMSSDDAVVVRDRVAGVAGHPCLQLDGKFEKVRERGGVRQKHVVIDRSGDASPFEAGDDRPGNRTEPGLGRGLAVTIGASRTLQPGEAGDPAVILSWTAATP